MQGSTVMLKITVGFSNSVFATQMEEVYVTAERERNAADRMLDSFLNMFETLLQMASYSHGSGSTQFCVEGMCQNIFWLNCFNVQKMLVRFSESEH